MENGIEKEGTEKSSLSRKHRLFLVSIPFSFVPFPTRALCTTPLPSSLHRASGASRVWRQSDGDRTALPTPAAPSSGTTRRRAPLLHRRPQVGDARFHDGEPIRARIRRRLCRQHRRGSHRGGEAQPKHHAGIIGAITPSRKFKLHSARTLNFDV